MAKKTKKKSERKRKQKLWKEVVVQIKEVAKQEGAESVVDQMLKSGRLSITIL